jgi:hypothetical protein
LLNRPRRSDADSRTRVKGKKMSQRELPRPKPDLMVKAWIFVIAATGPLAIYAGLAALAMLLTALVLVGIFGR